MLPDAFILQDNKTCISTFSFSPFFCFCIRILSAVNKKALLYVLFVLILDTVFWSRDKGMWGRGSVEDEVIVRAWIIWCNIKLFTPDFCRRVINPLQSKKFSSNQNKNCWIYLSFHTHRTVNSIHMQTPQRSARGRAATWLDLLYIITVSVEWWHLEQD